MTKVAFVSFRLKAQDGVSVEAEKWIRIFAGWGFDICRVAGYIHDPQEKDYVVPELNSQDPRLNLSGKRRSTAGATVMSCNRRWRC